MKLLCVQILLLYLYLPKSYDCAKTSDKKTSTASVNSNNSLIFGADSLQDICSNEDQCESKIPVFVLRCVTALETKEAMDERLAFIEEYLPDANLRNNITQEVLLLENKVNTGQLDYDLSTKSALVVALALKRFLFKLKSPLISKDLAESMRLKQAKLTGKNNQVTGLVLDINGMSRENRKTLGVLLKMAQKRINYNANSANKDNSLVKLLSSALCQAFYPMGPSPEIANNQLFHGISNTAMNKRNEYELNITPCIEYMITNIGKTFDLRRFDYYIIKLKDSFKKIDPAK